MQSELNEEGSADQAMIKESVKPTRFFFYVLHIEDVFISADRVCEMSTVKTSAKHE